MTESQNDALSESPPNISPSQASEISRDSFGLDGHAQSLPSERDQNFAVQGLEGDWVLKVSNPAEDLSLLDLQTATLCHLQEVAPHLPFPALRLSRSGDRTVEIKLPDGRVTVAWMVKLLPGKTLESTPGSVPPLKLGRTLAEVNIAMRGFYHPAGRRDFLWDIAQAGKLRPFLRHTEGPLLQRIEEVLDDHSMIPFRCLRAQFIHNDLNPANLLQHGGTITGIVDFGDMVHAPMINDLAIAAAYQLYDTSDPETFLCKMVQGWHDEDPLLVQEISLLPLLMLTRMATTVVVSRWRAARYPENCDYILLHTRRAEEAVMQWGSESGRTQLVQRLLRACGMASHSKSDSSKLLHDRRQVLGPSLRLFYEEPLHLESGRGCELFDINGRSYLDCYNNVAHVGHGHPAVATAIARQTKQLNTNTRYLIDQVVNYARRLSDLFPDPLNVVRFTCTGSEATDLAYRIAQAATGAKGALVSENAYHGNTSIGLALSPEETGVESVPDWVATMAVSDLLRGTTDGKASNAVRHACEALRAQGHSPAALLFDSLLTSDGIFALDPDIARKWVSDARSSGAVWIADEVQPGFGRTGCAFWGFERFGIVPDMVTLGKPMGNGYPLAAIIMTEAMAQAAQSVYYFNTFAGNPVAAAAGNAVLDVIEDEALQAKAQSVGALLVDELSTLARSHPSISEIRGLGLHLGVDMIDPSSKQPSAEFAQLLVNRLKKHRVLVGRTGQHMNVMKIRPPLAFGVEEVPLLISAVDCALGELGI